MKGKGLWIVLGLVIGFIVEVNAQEGLDMYSPNYYSTEDTTLKTEIDALLAVVEGITFQHPLSDANSDTPEYRIGREFGAGIGPANAGSHHPATDYYIGNRVSDVNLYAAHDGVVRYDKTVSRYRHFLSITKDIMNDKGELLGKLVTLYAHIEIDLDIADGLNLDGVLVNRGDLLSKHLYTGTMGGPHLHLELRYYRPDDVGTEDFYGGNVGGKTLASAGPWSYGYWNPTEGYGFGNPERLFWQQDLALDQTSFKAIHVYPNPTKDSFSVDIGLPQQSEIKVFNTQGKLLKISTSMEQEHVVDLQSFPDGAYVFEMDYDNKRYRNIVLKR